MHYQTSYTITDWLPTSKKEVQKFGWNELDVILFTGDAYIDHPAFGSAVISRVLESLGLRVAIIPQPNWRDDLRDFKKLGKPRLFFAVTSGNMDSMVNHYTANKRLRSDDAYTPGGKAGQRPDYAVTVYSNILKRLYPETPIIIGGIEASLRRFTHFDYWSNQLKPNILFDSNADLLVYGMGEKPIKEIVRRIEKGRIGVADLKDVPQTAFLSENKNEFENNSIPYKLLNSHEECLASKEKFASNFKEIERESYKLNSVRLVQQIQNKYLIVNATYPTQNQHEIDEYYEYPYTRLPHPRYEKKEKIPAYEMIKFSISIHRGCFGACSFCTISAHQGKFIQSRSPKSVLKELEKLTKLPEFKGYISDLGGPSANMYKMKGKDEELCKKCQTPSCIHPTICENLDTNHNSLINLYEKVRKHPKIKKVTIGSGIRYDLLTDFKSADQSKNKYFENLVKYHVSGRLKVAPEHTSNEVLKIMRKPSFEEFRKFAADFEKLNKKLNLNQQLIPYFISSHPGSTIISMAELAIKVKSLNFRLEQIQDFTPTPMTLATVMFYTSINPYNKKTIYTARNKQDKLAQRQFFFSYKKEYKQQIIRALNKHKRSDLINKILDNKKSFNKRKK